MRIAILTTKDPLYLPSCLSLILGKRASDVVGIYAVPTRYKGQSAAAMYLRSFGLWNFIRLVVAVLACKVQDVCRSGRSGGVYHSVRSAARGHKVPYREVSDVNDVRFIETLTALSPDVIVSLSCPQLFRGPLLRIPRLGVLNLHGSRLPHYRGLLPSFWMMKDGVQDAAVTIFVVNEGIDLGDIVGQRVFAIMPSESLHEFLIRSKHEAALLTLETLHLIEAGQMHKTPMTAGGSYFSWPSRSDYLAFLEKGRRLW